MAVKFSEPTGWLIIIRQDKPVFVYCLLSLVGWLIRLIDVNGGLVFIESTRTVCFYVHAVTRRTRMAYRCWFYTVSWRNQNDWFYQEITNHHLKKQHLRCLKMISRFLPSWQKRVYQSTFFFIILDLNYFSVEIYLICTFILNFKFSLLSNNHFFMSHARSPERWRLPWRWFLDFRPF